MLLNPKQQPIMELTEDMARNILRHWDRTTYCEDCHIRKFCNEGKLTCLDRSDDGTADEVFAAVRELAGGVEPVREEMTKDEIRAIIRNLKLCATNADCPHCGENSSIPMDNCEDRLMLKAADAIDQLMARVAEMEARPAREPKRFVKLQYGKNDPAFVRADAVTAVFKRGFATQVLLDTINLESDKSPEEILAMIEEATT